ncbi:MAG TPA: hypothetical protein VF103_03805 [Polyangiaceae bacterium]
MPLARAQATNKALAEELFREGQTLVEAKRFSEACPKFAESQRLDPGTGTLLNLAACHEGEGKLASAWTEYSEVVTLATRDNRPDRVSYAEERLKAIQPQLARLTVEVSSESDVPGLVVELDGAPVGRAALGVAVPVDPGTHTVEAKAPGKQPWQTTVDISAGASNKSVTVPSLVDAPQTTAGPTGAAKEEGDKSSKPADDGSTQRLIAYTLGGAGVVGLGIGTAFGLSAISKNKKSNSEGCSGNECSPEAAEIRKEARSAGTASTIAFAAGGALLAAGVVVYFTAPSAGPTNERKLGLALGPASAYLEGTW